jgi:hypothetical protein
MEQDINGSEKKSLQPPEHEVSEQMFTELSGEQLEEVSGGAFSMSGMKGVYKYMNDFQEKPALQSAWQAVNKGGWAAKNAAADGYKGSKGVYSYLNNTNGSAVYKSAKDVIW